MCEIHIFTSAYIYIYIDNDLIRRSQIASLPEKPGGFLFFFFVLAKHGGAHHEQPLVAFRFKSRGR